MDIVDQIKNVTSSLATSALDATGTNGLASSISDKLKAVNGSSTGSKSAPIQPFDPLTSDEISRVVATVRRDKPEALFFNAVTLQEPRKAVMLAWLEDPDKNPRPQRIADVVAIGKGSKVFDGLVDLSDSEAKVLKWEFVEGVQPLITMEDLKIVEGTCRKDPKVIEQCGLLGIPPEDMHKVYCDPWTIGYDSRYGSKIRLQQALMYYRPDIDDCQYSYPLDFCPIYDSDKQEIIDIDIPEVRRPLSKAPPINYHAKAIQTDANPTSEQAVAGFKGLTNGTNGSSYGHTNGHTNGKTNGMAENGSEDLKRSVETGYRTDVKPLITTQPKGVSFKLHGRHLTWQNWSVNVGFNYREGIVLHDIRFYDRVQQRLRPIFYRISLAEMVVPYGNPEHPHQRKHAFDLGEYGGGYMTNSLALGCDCKGSIQYLDADFVARDGSTETIKNAICIHEEDSGILFKHTDFRDNSTTVTRARKLVISQIFTAANYEYCVYWILHQDGTVQLEIKLTGILNTYACNPDEDLHGWGTQVYPGVNAHNHQHLFCLRINPNVDGPENSVVQVDATAGSGEVGSKENFYGNAFYPKRTRYNTAQEAMAEYDGNTSRTWDMCNESKPNPFSGKPVAYKLVSREVPKLLPKEGSLVWKRAGFARKAVHVTRYDDNQIHPAGRHVPQTSGDTVVESNTDLPTWISANPEASVANTDIVLWHTFGLTHFPAPEDYPVMPAEPMTVLLRPRNFFDRNPVMDVPPSYSSWPSQVKENRAAYDAIDGQSTHANACC